MKNLSLTVPFGSWFLSDPNTNQFAKQISDRKFAFASVPGYRPTDLQLDTVAQIVDLDAISPILVQSAVSMYYDETEHLGESANFVKAEAYYEVYLESPQSIPDVQIGHRQNHSTSLSM